MLTTFIAKNNIVTWIIWIIYNIFQTFYRLNFVNICIFNTALN